MRKFLIAGCGLLALSAGAAAADTVAAPLAALQQCKAMTDPQARLACYDAAVASLSASAASGDVVVLDRTQVRKARKDLFGFSVPRIGFLAGRDGDPEDQADAARLESAIKSARSLGYGKWRFTVEAGSVWEMVEAYEGFDDPAPGRKIVIEKGLLGAFYAKIEKERRVLVRRIS